jgi:uncharacterized membrane protein YeaQ/YmgE (transglycosylase-associated protein family)
MLWAIIVLIAVGLVAGFIARAVVPGPDPMSVGQTILLGIVGSFVGGLLGYLIFGRDIEDGAVQTAGILGSIIGSIIVLMIYRATSGRRHRGLIH